MATIIDALIVTFGLDNSGFKKGAKDTVAVSKQTSEALDKQAKEIERAQKAAADQFNKITGAALRFFSVLTAGRGVIDFTRDVIESGASLERLSQNIGVAVSTISQWGRATELTGGSQEAFQGTLSGLSKMFTEIKMTGTSAVLPYFRMLGVSIADANGKAKPLTDILLDLSDAFQKLPRNDAFNIGRSMGIDEGTMNLLLQGRGAVQNMLDVQKRQAAVTDEQAKQALVLSQRWTQIRQGLDAVGSTIVYKVTPYMLKFFDMIEQGVDWLTQHKDIAEAFFAGVAIAAAVALAPLVALIAPFLAIAAGIAATGAAFAALRAAWDAWMASSPATAAAWGRVWTGAIDAVMAVWRLLVAVFTGNSVDITNAWRGAANAFKSLFGGAFDFVKTAWKNLVDSITGFMNGDGPVSRWLRGRVNAILGTDGATQGGANAAPAVTVASASTVATGGATPDLFRVRSVRNNNPGNLNFTHQAGASLENGPNARFAKFGTMEEGVSQLARQLMLYRSRGLNSLNAIMAKFAPISENNTKQYIATLSKKMGVGADQQIDVSNPQTMRALVLGISQYEAGKSYLTNPQLDKGLQMAGIGPASRSNVTTKQSLSVGKVIINTQATDARGVARDFRREMVSQAETGMR